MRVSAMVAAVQPRLFTADEYYAMGGAGVFAPDERVELLDGEILTMPPIGPPHAANVTRLTALFIRRLGARACVRCQSPVHLSNDSNATGYCNRQGASRFLFRTSPLARRRFRAR